MAYDKLYYFDKLYHHRYELGEIQTNFNFNLVIDGDKDSEQVDVYSFSRDALEPNTIIYHATTNTWWVVKKDQVKRNMNEVGYMYTHSITLNGAIDLLKNRDLTDCGFNANNYTIDTFFKKLLKLSNFEFDYSIDYGTNVDRGKKVDYIKSYENYALLTAIRDFFNGYNCDIKMDFETQTISNVVSIKKAIFKIIPRTGNIDIDPINISAFNDIRESINFDKESYGTTVVSNAQNVVSTLAKTFPQVGGVRLTGSDYLTSWDGAYIKLPSPAWKVNWVSVSSQVYVVLKVGANELATEKLYLSGMNDTIKALNELEQVIINSSITQESKDFILGVMHDSQQRQIILDTLLASSRITFYNNPSYNPHTDTIIQESTTPYIPFLVNDETGSDYAERNVVLMDKDSRSLLKDTRKAIYWERGSDKIEGIKTFDDRDDEMGVYFSLREGDNDTKAKGLAYPLKYRNNDVLFTFFTADLDHYYHSDYIYQIISKMSFWQVNYIPMSDIKAKQDNENNTKDIQLYNQNGKLNDSVALSKMLDSYSKEIESPTITRYMEYTNFNDIPKVGQIVMDGTKKYVINNISYNVYPNESNSVSTVGYRFECEFTLSEFISTKSIMTSPNTNVRDYGIPQKYNIKRRQVYRDYYELGFEEEELANQETPYAKLENYLQLGIYSLPKDFDHTALIKIDYEEEVDGQTSWYYQLNSTVYTMAKSIYEIIDFNDNNIIGYDIQNSDSGWDLSNLWSQTWIAITTPVSYVDDNGKFVGITIKMVGAEALENAYSTVDTQGHNVLLSSHCFIGEDLYNLASNVPTQATTNNVQEVATDLPPIISVGTYTHSFEINISDLGLPSGIELTLDNIVGIVDKSVYVDQTPLLDSMYSLTIISISNNKVQLTFSAANANVAGGQELSISFAIEYTYTIEVVDYIINEPNYEKDAIEVPVFEYSLQMGDTKDVEVGDNILKNNVGMVSFYSCYIVDKNKATPLNASNYNEGVDSISASSYSDPNQVYDTQIVVSNDRGVDFSLEDNNTKLRIKVYTSVSLLFYGIEGTTTNVFQSATNSGIRYEKSNLIDKDIVIFRHTINSIKHVSGSNFIDCDDELMYIIHAPQNEQFDGNDIVLNLNYYKLR